MTGHCHLLRKTIEEFNRDVDENCAKVTTWIYENKLCLNAYERQMIVASTKQRLRRMDTRMARHANGWLFTSTSKRAIRFLLGVSVQADLT